MRIVAGLLWSVCLITCAGEAPKTMIRLVVKAAGPGIAKDSFAAEPKRMFRAGSGYCRIEENPDLKNGIHGLMIVNEPDVWMVNRLAKSARHMVDPGPTYNCRLPIFATSEDVKSEADLKKEMLALEFGRELEFFRARCGTPQPGPELQGKKTRVYEVKVGSAQLFLFTAGEPEAPVAVARATEAGKEFFWYGEYEQVPFDAKLFARPEGVEMEEMK